MGSDVDYGMNDDLDGWASIEAAGEAEVLFEGSYPWLDWDTGGMAGTPNMHMGPLALRYSVGSGVVLYTTLHNESQLIEDMDNLLIECVLSLSVFCREAIFSDNAHSMRVSCGP